MKFNYGSSISSLNDFIQESEVLPIKTDVKPSINVSRKGSVPVGKDEKVPTKVMEIEEDILTEAQFIALNEFMTELMNYASDEGPVDVEEFAFQEGVGTVARKVGDKVKKVAVNVTLAQRRASEQLNLKFNKVIKDFREARKMGSYDKIVKESINASRTLKNLIGSVVLSAFIPGGIPVKLISMVIMMLLKVAHDKRTDEKYKQTIMNDLRFELKIVQEKIKDAEVKGNTRAKYSLMRIENQLARAIDKIKFGFKD